MDTRKIIILLAGSLLVILFIAFVSFKEFSKEIAPASVQPAPQQAAAGTSQARHAIPQSTTYSLEEIKSRIKSQEAASNTEPAAARKVDQTRTNLSTGASATGAAAENAVPTADNINEQIKDTEERNRQSQQIADKNKAEAERIHAQAVANPVGEPSPVSASVSAGGTSTGGASSPYGAGQSSQSGGLSSVGVYTPSGAGAYAPSGGNQPSQSGSSSSVGVYAPSGASQNEGFVSAGASSQSGTGQPSQQGSGTVNPQGGGTNNASGGESESRGGIITY